MYFCFLYSNQLIHLNMLKSLFIALCMLSIQVIGQNVDSLESLTASGDPIQRIDALNKLGWESRMTDPVASLAYLQSAYDEQINDTTVHPFGWAQTANHYGCVYTLIGRFVLADSSLRLASARFEALSENEEAGKSLVNLGINFYYQGKGSQAIEYCEKALPFFDNYPIRKAKTSQNIGVFYRTLGRYDKAIEMYTNALDIFQSEDDVGSQLATLNNIGSLYVFYRQYDKSLEYHNRSMELAVMHKDVKAEASAYVGSAIAYDLLEDYEKALNYGWLARNLYDSLGITHWVHKTDYTLASTYFSMDSLDKAIGIYRSLIEPLNEINDQISLTGVYNGIGLILAKLNRPDSAIVYLEKALEELISPVEIITN